MASNRLGPTLAAAVLAVASMAPGAARAQDAFLEVFRDACLSQIPDFAGSPTAFAKLGFTESDGRYRRKADGQEMLAEVYQRTVDTGGGCVLAFEAAEDTEVVAQVEALVADLAGDDVHRRNAERGGRRVDAFQWKSDGWDVLVVVLPRVSGMQALNVTVAESQ